ncbi:MAG: flavodoxin domain-containing protein [Sporolactobacillus sp.]
MTKILVAYASQTGNTEEIAFKIAEGVRSKGIEPDVKELFDLTAEELSQYDGVLMGSFTAGLGDLPLDAEYLLEEVGTTHLEGTYAACFGSGDRRYGQYFAAAVDTIQTVLSDAGAQILVPPFKIERSLTDDEATQAVQLGASFIEKLHDRTN